MSLNHPILEQSFAVIDREIGAHNFTPAEYAIVRRVIHSTADFEFKHLLRFSPGAIESAIAALSEETPIVTDVNMVAQGIVSMAQKTFKNLVIAAIDRAPQASPGKTRTASGLLNCWQEFPQAIYVIGNAPTALLALCEQIRLTGIVPPIVVGAPVGFIAVVESKAALAEISIPQILIEGRKGGSAAAAAIANALLVLAWEQTQLMP